MSDRSDLTRRDVLKVLGAAAAAPLVRPVGDGAGPAEVPGRRAGPRGTPSDPDLLRPRIWWPKVLTPPELATLAVLCDTIIPADDRSPSASQLGAPDFINEWASAPWDDYRAGLARIRAGIGWLDAESARRFGRPFAGLTEDERHRICDDICHLPKARPEHQAAATFFDLIRDLTATAFYTTREGMKDIGYVGNVPLQRFDPPAPEVLRRLGLDGER